MNKNKIRRNQFRKLRRALNLKRQWQSALSLLLIFTLVIVPLTTFDSFVSHAQYGCNSDDPNGIFQRCSLGGGAVEQALEDQAINDVMKLYKLQPSERSRLLAQGRNLIRGLLYARLLELIKKQSPTAEEQQALAIFAGRIKQKRVEATTFALDEYQIWNYVPCLYHPPAPLEYDPGASCYNPLAALFAGPRPPSFEEFQQMGALKAYGELDTPQTQQVATESSRSAVVAGSVAAVGLGALVGSAIGSVLPIAVLEVVFPFAFRTFFTLGGASFTGSLSGAAVVGGAAAIVIAALTIAIIQTIDIVNDSKIQGKLETAKSEAQNLNLNLQQLINTDAGVQEVYGAFILATLPDLPSGTIPPPSANDRQFIVRQNGSSGTTDSPIISYKDWDGFCHTARQSGPWFVDADQKGIEKLTISINYVDWNNNQMTASRTGSQFILTKPGVAQDTVVVDEIQYKDCASTLKGARLKFEQMIVTTNPLIKVSCQGIEQEGQNVVIGSVAGSGDPASALTAQVNDAASATVNGLTVNNLAVNGQYQITANVIVPQNTTPLSADFTVKVTNGIAQTSSATFTIKRTFLQPLSDIQNSVNVNTPYSSTFRNEFILYSCGTPNSTFSVTDGTLPNGISIQRDNSGFTYALKGTPTVGGKFLFTVTEILSNGEIQSRIYSINVISNLAEVTTGTESWWRGERNTDDVFASHDGSLFGSAGFAPGLVNDAFKFNGTNGYVALPTDTFRPTSTFSYELWFKTSSRGVILGQQNGAAPYTTPSARTAPIYIGTDGKLRVEMFTDNEESTRVISPNRVNDNYYHHLAVVYYNIAKTEEVYLDGTLIDTRSNYEQLNSGGYVYQLGTGYIGDSSLNMFGWYNFNGLIDEPTLYNRALTQTEIRAIYTAGGAGKISINATPIPPSSYNGTDGAINMIVKGGTPSLRFSKDGGSTFQETSNFNNLTPGAYNIVVKDGANRTVTRTITVANTPPTVTLSAASSNPTCTFTQTGRITLYATGTTGQPQYSVLNGANAQTSNVFEGLSAGTTYTPWVRDPSGVIVTGDPIVLTNPSQLTISPTTDQTAAVGQLYSQTFTSNGGTGARHMTATNLPPGFTATSTASGVTVSGTAQQSGNLTFFIQVEDGSSCQTAMNVNLTVTDNCPSMTVGPVALPVGTAGQPFPTTDITPSSGAAPFAFTISGLPNGMTSTATSSALTIGGTPAQAGLYPITVSATSANSCMRTINYQLVINRAGNPSGAVLISEVRTGGPNGPDDEFVELYNNTNSPIDLQGWSLVQKGFTCDTAPSFRASITQNTILPARGHFLMTGSAYSLGSAAASNYSLINGGLDDNVTLALFNTNIPSQMTPNTRQDAVAIGINPTGNYCDLLREGDTYLESPAGSTAQHSYVRQIKVAGTGAGRPVDTNDNAANFALVSTDASFINNTQSILGAPGPENLASPIQRESTIVPSYTDPMVCSTCAPNLVRNGSGNSGTLTIRRHFTNNTGAPVTNLRFRVIDITTLGSPLVSSPQAQLTIANSTDQNVSTSMGQVLAKGTQIEQPPNQSQGGGLNTSLSVGLPAGGLSPGASIDVQWLMQVVQNGRFRFYVTIEALP